MDPQIERTILHYYPQRRLVSPLSDERIRWEYDPKYETLKAILRDLEQSGGAPRPGTRGRYDISEELIVFGSLHLQLSYLGPWAAINYELDVPSDEDLSAPLDEVEKVLETHGVRVLEPRELDESVVWISPGSLDQVATVWSCLFLNETRPAEPPPTGVDEEAIKPVTRWR